MVYTVNNNVTPQNKGEKSMKRLQGFILGVIITAFLLGSVPVLAESISVLFNNINIRLNGEKVASAGESYELDNGDTVPFSILYKGTTYLPLRKVSEILGKEVNWDGTTNTAFINDAVVIEKPVENQEIIDNGNKFQEEIIETIIRQQLKKVYGEITEEDLLSIKELIVVGNPQNPIKSLRGVERLKNLEVLSITHSGISDVSYLKDLTKLKTIEVIGGSISDISYLGGLLNLEVLRIGGNYITDISVIGKLSKLRILGLVGQTNLTNIDPLGELTQLQRLSISDSSISDISILLKMVDNGNFMELGDSVGYKAIDISNNRIDLNDKRNLDIIQFLLEQNIEVKYTPQK